MSWIASRVRTAFSQLRHRLRALFRRSAMERELDDELRHHIALETEKLIDDGLDPREARRRALMAFGGVERHREATREAWGVRWLVDAAKDARYASRQLRRRPGFTAVAVITLALGIGATTAIFSVVDAVLLRPLPYPDADRLVRVLHHHESDDDVTFGGFSREDFEDLERENDVYDAVAAYRWGSKTVLTGGGEPLELDAAYVSADFFRALGVPAALGRTLGPQDAAPDANRAIVVSDGLWRGRFGSDPGVIGRAITLDGEPSTIVGVMPPSFDFPLPEADVWGSLSGFDCSAMPCGREQRFLQVVGRLAPGETRETAGVGTNAVLRRLEQSFPATNEGWGTAKLVPLHESLVGDVRPALLVLFGAVALVLLIACVNVANLLLARGTTRGRELAIRTALGAGRSRVVRQLLTESIALALVGGALGLVLAFQGVDALVALSAESIPRWYDIQPDVRVAVFALAASLLTGLLFGIWPSLTATRIDPREQLAAGGRTDAGGGRRRRSRGLLVAVEVAMAVVLLTGAGLLIKSFWNLTRVDTGFSAENVLSLSIDRSADVMSGEQRNAYRRRIIDRIESLPGIVAVGGGKDVPLHGPSEWYSFTLPGRADAPPLTPETYIVIGDYFRALGIPLLEGRTFTEADETDRALVVVINRALAQRYWPDRDPVGERLMLFGRVEVRVVGVVGDVRHRSITEAPAPAVYVPPHFGGRRSMKLFVRTTGDPASMAGAVRQAVWDVDPNQPVADIAPMREVVAETIRAPRFLTLLLAGFAGLAVLLAALGVYGVTAYSVSRRTYEVGVRMALGADGGDVLRLIMRQGIAPVLGGTAFGLVVAVAVTRVLSSLLFSVDAADPVVFASVALGLLAVGLLAVYVPGRRATRVDPVLAVRAD